LINAAQILQTGKKLKYLHIAKRGRILLRRIATDLPENTVS